jgi:hypothetical protein
MLLNIFFSLITQAPKVKIKIYFGNLPLLPSKFVA